MRMQLTHSNSAMPVAAAALMYTLTLAANARADTFEWAKRLPEQGPSTLTELARKGGAQAESASWKKVAARRLADVSLLAAGWDGGQSIAVHPNAIATAERLLDVAFRSVAFPAVPSVVPCGDGSVQLEWRLNDSRFELEIEADGQLGAWALDRPSNISTERNGFAATQLLLSWAHRLTADKYVAA